MNNCGSTENIDLKALLYMRSQIYFLLSRAFEKEVDRLFLNQLRDYMTTLKEIALNSDDETFIKGAQRLENFIKSIDHESIDKQIEELACNFALLFLNVATSVLETEHVHPFGSVYLSESELLYQKETEDVLKYYIQNKVALKKDFKEPEDHIAVELSFIALITNHAIKVLESNNITLAKDKINITKNFMEKHLLPWVHKLCTDLKNTANDDFYRSIADITLGFICDYKY